MGPACFMGSLEHPSVALLPHQSAPSSGKLPSEPERSPAKRSGANRAIFLEAVEVREGEQRRIEPTKPVVDALMRRRERFLLAGVVMEDADSADKAQLPRALAHLECVLRVLDARAQHGVDSDAELRVLDQPLQLAVEYLESLLRNRIR